MNRIFLIQPNKLLKKFYSRAIWNFNRSEKNIFLTFDDGPIPNLTEWILDELKKYNAKATFFCVGENIIKHPHVFKRIIDEGHQVGNHTQNHIKGFNHDLEDYLKNVDACETLTKTKLFRAPYGRLRKKQYRSLLFLNYKIVFWDVISYDYEKISKEDCYNIVSKRIKNGSIVLFHDNMKAERNVKYALSKTLSDYTSKGYTFKRIN